MSQGWLLCGQLDYIGNHLNHKVQLIQRKTYSEINALFSKGELDLAFICSGPYANDRKKYGFQAFAVPEVRGQSFYQSYLIVNQNSAFNQLGDLSGGMSVDPDDVTRKGIQMAGANMDKLADLIRVAAGKNQKNINFLIYAITVHQKEQCQQLVDNGSISLVKVKTFNKRI